METEGAGRTVGSESLALPRPKLQHPGATVFIVSDVRLLRDGLVLSLSQQPSLAVVGSADLTISPTHIASAHPDVALLDVGTLGKLHVRRRGEVAARMRGSALLCRGVPSP